METLSLEVLRSIEAPRRWASMLVYIYIYIYIYISDERNIPVSQFKVSPV